MEYLIRRIGARPELRGDWQGPAWCVADTLEVAHFLPESSEHRPRTRARLLYDEQGFYGIFRVNDRYVRCVRTEFQSFVSNDSCVEFFVQPARAPGYFNFEFNCGGTFLCYYVTDPDRSAGSLAAYTPLAPEDGARVRIYHSLPETVEPEIEEDAEWFLEFFIPFSVLSRYAGPLGEARGAAWRANFYKCGDETSHPHWATWAPVPEKNFHLPQCFGVIRFEP